MKSLTSLKEESLSALSTVVCVWIYIKRGQAQVDTPQVDQSQLSVTQVQMPWYHIQSWFI